MGRVRREASILRGTKIGIFLLSVLIATVLTSGLLTRPTQAVFFNSQLACWLNIGVCPAPGGGVADDETDPVDDLPPKDTTQPSEPGDDPTPSDPNTPAEPGEEDTAPPRVLLEVDRLIVGGNTHTVLITGTVADEHLESYVLSLEGRAVKEVSGITESSVDVSMPWNVAEPERIPSGIYTITLEARDKSGNVFGATLTVEVDNDGPIVSLSGGDVIIKSGSISPRVIAENPDDIVSYAWVADKANPGAIEYDQSAKEPVFTPFFEGTYVFYLTTTDSLGNASLSSFSFGYARQLAIVPLPVIENLNEKIVAPPSASSTSSSAEQRAAIVTETKNNDTVAVLGNTVTTDGPSSLASAASTVAPTSSGWSILGILWYWWVGIVAAILIGLAGVKKVILSRRSQDS